MLRYIPQTGVMVLLSPVDSRPGYYTQTDVVALEAELAAEREKVERLEGLLKQVSERVDQLTDIPMVMLGAAVIAIRVDIAAALNPDGEK